jgi:nicotinate dehydrogenase subunit B
MVGATSDSVELIESGFLETLDRRQFLRLFGSGIFLFFTLEDAWGDPQAARSYPSDFNAYLRIGDDGKVTGYTGKIEMGQGINISLAQMLAEELEVQVQHVTMVLGDTALCPWDGGTNGSRSTKYFGPAIRQAGAEAREILIQLGAAHLGLEAALAAVKDGYVFEKSNPPHRVSYGSLAAGKIIERHLDGKPALKKPNSFAVCGKSFPRPDGALKVRGKAQYTGDIRLPGMVYARILRPPSLGAKLVDLDASAIQSIDKARLIREDDFVAVVHPAPDLAEKGFSLLRAKYEAAESGLDETNIHQHLAKVASGGEVAGQKGDITLGKSLAVTRFRDTYFTPYVAHAPMETHTALARVEGEEATVWISTQRPFGAQEELAKAMRIPAAKVRVITPLVGGGFGGKSAVRQAVEAVRLSRLAGCPVQVAWSRDEEFLYDTYMPAAYVDIDSGMNSSKEIVYWDYAVSYAGERCSQTFYNIPHHRTAVGGGRMPGGGSAHPLGTGAWRGPGSNTNVFARESHMDVMAAAAGIDPLEFRLRHLKDSRMVKVVKAAADKFGWTAAPAPSGRGLGMACLDYLNSYVAGMAEVKVDKSTGAVRVLRVVLAQDMGPVMNPEGARKQIEGCVAMGLGYSLSEEIRFRGGDVKDRNFDTYRLPRFSWMPKIETVLVENLEIEPQGCGEPAITCMGALLANAVFDATGARVRRLPLTAARVKSAMQK